MELSSYYTQETVNIWFPDQVEPPYNPMDDEVDAAFKTYWAKEKDRIVHGFTIADGAAYISGWLYWHTVYWQIRQSQTTSWQNSLSY